jgi:dTDP-4-dehydrorhamnose reductase
VHGVSGERPAPARPVALVTGAAGQLGGAFMANLLDEYAPVGETRQSLDVTSHAAVMQRVTEVRPAVIINCTAYTNVDGAEDDPVTAFAVNAFAVRSLARAARAVGAVLVHYSTDFVFSGDTDRPYTEDDQPSPQSVYAQSKLVGEWMAADVPEHYVLRVESLFGGPHARSSIDRIIHALGTGSEARVFSDRYVSPSFVEDVVAATRALLRVRAASGVYHCVNSGYATWLEVGEEIARQIGTPRDRLVPVLTSNVKLKAPRPRFAALEARRLARAGIVLPEWQDAVRRHLAAGLLRTGNAG